MTLVMTLVLRAFLMVRMWRALTRMLLTAMVPTWMVPMRTRRATA